MAATKKPCIIGTVTAVAEETSTAWPDGIFFWPPKQIDYQTDWIARTFLMGSAMWAADTGLGKSMMAMGVAGLCFEEGVLDHVMVCCEPNKMSEWVADFAAYTRLGALVYHGPRRKRYLDALPRVLITTYETARQDLAVFPRKGTRGKGSGTLTDGPLMLALRGKRVLVIYDEVTKLGRRTSNLYKAHYWALGQLRKGHPDGVRVIGMSATPMETDLENIFSEMRLIRPREMPTVRDFEDKVVRSRDPWGRPNYRADGMEWFRRQCAPYILRKRKSDPDVRGHFPPLTEKFRRIRMHADQYRIYQLLEDVAWDEMTKEHIEVPGLNILLRQLAGDPWAVLEAARVGESQLAKLVADEMGDELQSCSSAKAEQLVYDADLIMSSGGKLVVFTFFGQTVLPALVRRLGDRPVFTYHGNMPQGVRDQQKALFRDHQGGAILLASDAAARGINLPWVSNVTEYDVARTHATRLQRAGRGHRLGKQDPLTFVTYILESTVEAASSIRTVLGRNDVQDFILGDKDAENFTTADDRRALFAQARPRKAG